MGMGRSNPEPSFLRSAGARFDGDASGGDVEAGVLDGGADAVATLAYGGVAKPYGVEDLFFKLDAGEINLDVDNVGIDSINCSTTGF